MEEKSNIGLLGYKLTVTCKLFGVKEGVNLRGGETNIYNMMKK